MININNLTVKIENKTVLDNFNLNINAGEVHVLMGPNGVGKSSLCKVLINSKDYDATSDKLTFNNLNILETDTTTLAKEGMFFLAQSPIAIEGVTNAELLRASIQNKNDAKINIFEFNKELEAICEKLSLDKSFIHRQVNVGASGGERKKTELMHLWMLKPSFIMLDEIDSGLDVDALKIVLNSLKEYIDTYKPAILLVTHRPNILHHFNIDYVHILKDKKIVTTGDKNLADKIEKEGFNWTNEVTNEEVK